MISAESVKNTCRNLKLISVMIWNRYLTTIKSSSGSERIIRMIFRSLNHETSLRRSS